MTHPFDYTQDRKRMFHFDDKVRTALICDCWLAYGEAASIFQFVMNL
jgi:hypothetical protein